MGGAQVLLGKPGDSLDERERHRVNGRRWTAQIHHAEHAPSGRISYGGGRARPAVMGPEIVLRREDLHCAPRHERDADRVGADNVFTPACALHEPQMIGASARGRAPLPPQHPAV